MLFSGLDATGGGELYTGLSIFSGKIDEVVLGIILGGGGRGGGGGPVGLSCGLDIGGEGAGGIECTEPSGVATSMVP